MVPLIVIFLIVVFVTADVVIRFWMEKRALHAKRAERAAALDAGLHLVLADEAKSLRRVEIQDPKARILAVDDEEVVLDSLRKVLVLDGFALDTVENGPEALHLVQKHDYDFVFTDLKMPEMDGVEVVKAVKHLKPGTDVIVITGYATIETAVETMKLGAMDYIRKPFTGEELTKLVNKFLLRRNERLAREKRPTVHLVTPSVKLAQGPGEFNVLSGIFISPWHTWISIEPNGLVSVGLDDFSQKIVGKLDKVELPQEGSVIKKGQPLCTLQQGARSVQVPSPVSGTVRLINLTLYNSPELLNAAPYETGWICRLEPTSLPSELGSLRIGADAVSWYQEEVQRYLSEVRDQEEDRRWDCFCQRFLLGAG